jgi:hypothetical protein
VKKEAVLFSRLDLSFLRLMAEAGPFAETWHLKEKSQDDGRPPPLPK